MNDNGNRHASVASRLALSENTSLQALGAEEGGVLLRLDSGELYTVNDTTLAFLQELDGKRTVGAVVMRLIAIFDVDEATLTEDLVEIADQLIAERLVVIVG